MTIARDDAARYAGLSQPAVSKDLTVLKTARLVRHRREGRETHYRAQPDALAPRVDWLRHYSASLHAD
jgi:DNA-binding transcriptional ArsR family regulator